MRGAGIDGVLGGIGNDILYGEAGDDNIHGQDGADVIVGGAGADMLFGEEGNDIFYADQPDTYIIGGNGYDILYVDGAGGVQWNIDNPTPIFGAAVITGIEEVHGGPGDDRIFNSTVTTPLIISWAGAWSRKRSPCRCSSTVSRSCIARARAGDARRVGAGAPRR